jgi:hypothetical protein
MGCRGVEDLRRQLELFLRLFRVYGRGQGSAAVRAHVTKILIADRYLEHHGDPGSLNGR